MKGHESHDREDDAVQDHSRRFFLGRVATLAVGTALVSTLPTATALADDDDWFPGRRLGQRLREGFDRATGASRRSASVRDDDDDDDDRSRGRRSVSARDDDDDDDDRGRGRGRGGRGRDDDGDDDGDDRGGGGRGGRGRGGDDGGDDGDDD